LPEPVRIICREDNIEVLLAELALHRVDLVIADGPIPQGVKVRGYNHLLGECGISFFAIPELAKKISKGFPQSLKGAPMLLPGEMTVVRSRLVQWLDGLHIHPRIVGEFDDSALMKAFGQAGAGVFIAPTPMATEVEKLYGVIAIGKTEEVREQFYAISVERKITHPAVAAITETAREWLFPEVS
jgi:LysR family transcriptional activator of nhaA